MQIEIKVNGQSHMLEENSTLEQLVLKLNLAREGMALAVDDAIVPKANYAQFKLQQGMKVDIFSLVAGG